MHLTAVLHPLDAAVVRDESDSARPTANTGETKPARNDGAQSIGADDEVRPMDGHSASPPRMHANGATSAVLLQICDVTTLLDARARVSCALEQDGIETLPRECEAAVSEAAIAVSCNELAVNPGSIRRAHAHAGELGRTRAFDLVEHA
jgi:hypothetical protein